MSDIKGTRLLRKLIPSEALTFDAEPPYISTTHGKGWEIYFNGICNFAIWRGYFDVAGWSSEKLSAFISGAGWQETDSWTLANPNTGGTFAPEVKTWDIVSKAKLPNSILDGDKFADGAGFFGWNAPGMLNSNYNLEEIFAGRYRQYVPNTTLLNVMNQYSQELWGAGDATAGDKIHITRIVSCFSAMKATSVLFIPPQSVILPATLADEKDLVYMERLRRSYVNAESRNP